jgi:hypothetical protein
MIFRRFGTGNEALNLLSETIAVHRANRCLNAVDTVPSFWNRCGAQGQQMFECSGHCAFVLKRLKCTGPTEVWMQWTPCLHSETAAVYRANRGLNAVDTVPSFWNRCGAQSQQRFECSGHSASFWNRCGAQSQQRFECSGHCAFVLKRIRCTEPTEVWMQWTQCLRSETVTVHRANRGLNAVDTVPSFWNRCGAQSQQRFECSGHSAFVLKPLPCTGPTDVWMQWTQCLRSETVAVHRTNRCLNAVDPVFELRRT